MHLTTSELTGPLLDLLVAHILNVDAVLSDTHPNGTRSCVTFYGEDERGFMGGRSYCPSEHWSDGGPVKEAQGITSGRSGDRFFAYHPTHKVSSMYFGDTELQAAMRCVVGLAMGPSFELPAHLEAMLNHART